MKYFRNRWVLVCTQSLPLRERGLKFSGGGWLKPWPNVAPLAGAWIEIAQIVLILMILGSLPLRERGLKLTPCFWAASLIMSLPLRERGLKLTMYIRRRFRHLVAPLAGAWIEIIDRCDNHHILAVAPLAGAWIEIPTAGIIAGWRRSLPLRERGLKSLLNPGKRKLPGRRSPCGSVD